MTADEIENICVIGLGYIGLPTAIYFANAGYIVSGTDKKTSLIDQVNRGALPFEEPGLQDLLTRSIASHRLFANDAPTTADCYIIAVPSPANSDGSLNNSAIVAAAESIVDLLKAGDLVILESTVPPGTTEALRNYLLSRRADLSSAELLVAHCPERVLPGKVVAEFSSNARIIGGVCDEATAKAARLYGSFVTGEILTTDARTAELSKLVENTYRDVNIAFANELSLVSEALNIDVWELIRLANMHPRVNILNPGPGVGGHCIAVDPNFIISSAPREANLIRTARGVNDSMPERTAQRITATAQQRGATSIGLLGLTFKANVDDMRESPAVEVARLLRLSNPELTIKAADPHVNGLPSKLTEFGVELVPAEDLIAASEVIVLLVDHAEFAHLGAEVTADQTVIDVRGTGWLEIQNV